jgi:membrane protein implicated in regulation of membrane protease activity
MTEADRDAIAVLEARIEHLAGTIERCAKIATGARVLIWGGVALLALTLLAVLPMTATLFFGAITAVIAGVVLAGSNRATRDQAQAQIDALNDERDALIDALALRRVEQRPTLH